MNNWYYVLFLGILVFILAHILMKINTKKSTYNCVDFDDTIYGVSGLILSIISLILIIAIGIVILCCQMTAKEQYYKQLERYDYVMEVVETMDNYDYANFGVTSTILEYNSWLENARASKKAYGNWSFYKDYDLESLQYIGTKNNYNWC